VKPGFISVLIHVYHRLLSLYPAEFRDELGEEMTAVFSEAIAEARMQSRRLVAIRFLRELRDYPSSLWRAQKLSRRNQKEVAGPQPLIPADGIAEPVQFTRPSGLETAAAILPFVLMGLLYTFQALDYPSGRSMRSFYWDLSLYLLLLIGLGIGWVKGFPRWSLGYLGMALVFSWWLAGIAISGFRIFGHTFTHNEQWGWRGWISLLVVALVATLLSRSLYPLVGLAKSIWRDWSQLSFIVYGAFTWLALGITYDGKTFYNEIKYLPINIIIGAMIYTAGALFFMRLKTGWHRAVALQAAFNLAFLSSMAIGAIDGRVDEALQDNVFYWFFVIIFWFGIMLLPGSLAIIRRASQSLRPV
jgi:hypothetical protein